MKNFMTGLKVFLFFTVLTGAIYPSLVTLIAQLSFPHQANGSLIFEKSKIVGSELIAQSFKDPKYFWPRPSAVDFNPLPSGGSNLSPTNKDLLLKIEERKAQGFSDELLFASASGLDPHISKAAATAQIERIIKARMMNASSKAEILNLISEAFEARQLGFLGEPRINVLKLNLALDSWTRKDF